MVTGLQLQPGSQHVQTLPLSPGWRGTRETLQHMARLVRQGAEDQDLRQFIHRLISDIPARQWDAIAVRLFEYARDRVIYRRDPVGVEVVQSARATLELGYGDCDDKAIFLATALALVGEVTRFRVGSYDGREWGHVWVQWRRGKDWIDFDPTPRAVKFNGHTVPTYPGWHVNAKRFAEFGIFEGAGGQVGVIPGLDIAASVGVGLVQSLIGNQRTRQAAERGRDVIHEEFMSRLAYLKEDIEAGRIEPTVAIRTAEQLVRDYKATVFALPVESVRRSIGNKDPKTGKSQLDWIELRAKEAKDLAEVKRAQMPATPPATTASGTPATGSGTAATGATSSATGAQASTAQPAAFLGFTTQQLLIGGVGVVALIFFLKR